MTRRCTFTIFATLVACTPGKGDSASDGADSTSLAETGTIGHSSAPTSEPPPTTAPPTTEPPPTTAPPTTTEPPTTEPPTTAPPDLTTTTFQPGTTTGTDTGATTVDDDGVPLNVEETASAFIVRQPPPPPGDCDQWEEDCPRGQKCMPSASGGSPSWNAMRCLPIAPDPAPVGSPCSVKGEPTSGIDDCGLHAMCWDVDEALVGTCVAMCGGDPLTPICPPGSTCLEANNGVISLCVPKCDPLASACPEGQLCVPAFDAFACVPDASGEGGQMFDDCGAGNACDPGLACVPSALSPGCTGPQGECCLPTCDVDAPSTCPPAHDCAPWFIPEFVDPKLHHIGFCTAQ